MSKPLPTQNTFANLAPPWSLTSLDGNFSSVWAAINDIGTYSNTLTDVGTTNILVANPPGGVTFSLATGIAVDVIVANTTTATGPTLNVNGTGAKTITNPDGSALRPGAVLTGGIYRFVYDGTGWKCQTLGFGNTIILVKPAGTTRNSTTTPTNDPDLAISIALAGTYLIKGLIAANQNATGNIGINCNLNFSGTINTSRVNFFGNTASSGAVGTTANIASTTSAVQFSMTQMATFDVPITFDGIMQNLTSGTLAFAWAQNTSSATTTLVDLQSYLLIQRIG